MKRASRGFTLIEVIVVIGIIAIMTVASIPGITNTLEARALDGTARDILMALQTAKWKAASDKYNYRVRFSQVGASWKYQIEREAVSGTWTTAPGTLQKSISSKFGVTLTLPTTKDVIFTPTGFVSNIDSTKNSIMITSAKLASLSQQSNRTVRFYAGGSILFLKS
jgi:prepilin-type N-terminal cleavage/methylation domain-containing protein